MKLSEAIAVFDKSAERTTPNKQTEAWAVIRAELVALDAAPVARVPRGKVGSLLFLPVSHDFAGQRVRLVAASGGDGDA